MKLEGSKSTDKIVRKKKIKKKLPHVKVDDGSVDTPSLNETEISKNDAAEQLKLEDVLDLGGKKKDFKTLKDLNDDDSEISCDEDMGGPNVETEDIRNLINELGFSKKGVVFVEEKEENNVPTKEKSKKGVAFVEENKVPTKQKSNNLNADTNVLTKQKSSENQNVDSKNKNKFKSVPNTQKTTFSGEQSNNLRNLQDKHNPRKSLLFKPGFGKWYDYKHTDDIMDSTPIEEDLIKNIRKFVQILYDEELALYKNEQNKKKDADMKWMRKVISSGTLSDKVSALTIVIQEAPFHTLSSLETLIAMTKKKGRREAMMALDSLKEIFLNDLLLDRKLLSFPQHPFSKLHLLSSGDKDSRDRILLLWFFEEKLKHCYMEFVNAMTELLQDTISAVKKKALKCIYDLLVSKSEQEKLLLSLVVNKLGDPDTKLAAQTVHFLNRLVEAHPNMKAVIVLEVEGILYRPNVSPKAQYYAICFLHQLLLDSKDKELAVKLVKLYFSFFKACIKKKELDSKMMGALLSGVNRAYPYAKIDRTQIEDQMNLLHLNMQMLSFNTSIQAFLLMYQIMEPTDSSCDRYYTSLYKKLLDPELLHTSKKAIFLNLIYKSAKKDVCIKRVQAFVKRLLQVCCYSSAPFICGSLLLISELQKEKPTLLNFSKSIELENSDDEEHFQDVAIKDGLSLGNTFELLEEISQNDEKIDTDSDKKSTSSWVHKDIHTEKSTELYDPFARNPLYCNAEKDCIWELQRLSYHFHPTVKLYASSIIKGDIISYSGNPLEDFTLSRFLDRFVYKNPKVKEVTSKVQSVFKGKNSVHTPKGVRSVAVNSKEFLLEGEENVPVEDKFFFKYFSHIDEKRSAKLPKEYDSDASDVTDDEFDDYLETFEKSLVGDAAAEMDFAREMNKSKNLKVKKKKQDGEVIADSDADLSDEEADFQMDDDFKAAFAEFDIKKNDDSDDDLADKFENDLEDNFDDGELDGHDFDEDDLDENELDEDEYLDTDKSFNELECLGSDNIKKRKSRQITSSNGHKKQKNNHMDLFSAAEEFSHLLDQDMNVDTTSAFAVTNSANAGVKQLKWEKTREINFSKKNKFQKHSKSSSMHKSKMIGKNSKSKKIDRKNKR